MTSSKMKLTVATPLTAVVLLLGAGLSAPAAAEDSPFEGLYLGINGGVVWSDSTITETLASTSTAPVVSPPIVGADVAAINGTAHLGGHHHTGFTGGIEGGYNWVSNGLLIGFETDLDLYGMTGTNTASVTSAVTPTTTYTLTQKLDTDFLWTLRPRIGYAGGNFAIFASGGLAFTTVKYHATFSDSSTAGDLIHVDQSKSKTGWTLGAGLAYAIGNNISLKGEYLYTSFGTENRTGTSANGFYTLTAHEDLKSHLFRAGLDYRF